MEYVLKTNSLKKHYGSHYVLKGLTMNVPSGSIYGFVGKNGAGKTTAIRVICGLQQPSGGNYSLYGTDFSSRTVLKARRRMGAVIETPALYSDMSARDNLKMQCRILGLPSERNVDHLLHLVGLKDTGRKKVRNFSLGMKQRLGIAAALTGSPDFLILDEPMNGLDPEGIIEIRELLLDLNKKKGITILISSHILDELSKISTHFGFLNNGVMVREISAENLHSSCRRRKRIKVSDIRALSTALDKAKADYSIISDDEADIFSDITITGLTKLLSAAGCELIAASEHDESLESYYMNLIGGGKND